jgi:hypothetical protein
VEQDPFINFLSNLTEKIKVEKEHKALMEKINSNTEIPSVLPLEETLLNLQEKINQQVQAHLQEISPGVEPVILEGVIEQPQAIVEEKNFEDFVDKLKTILTSPRAEIPIVAAAVVEEEAPIEEEPVKEIEPIVNPYVQELQKQSVEKAPESNKYINDLDKLTTKVIAEKQPEKIEDVKKLIEEYVTKYARRILDLGGGGGSVAQQFANGGTMNGTLNVTGQYLSGGVDLADVIIGEFSTGNIAFSGNQIYTTNGRPILLTDTSVTSLTASNITANNSVKSNSFYTSGLILSGYNINADPAYPSYPMIIGGNSLPGVSFLCPVNVPGTSYFDTLNVTNLNVVSATTTNTTTLTSFTVGINSLVPDQFNQEPLTVLAQAVGSVYNQIQNSYAGVSASSDIAIYNDTNISYIDMGINSSLYNGNLYSPTFNVVGANDSYIYSYAGNLGIGTATNNNLLFFTGGTTTENQRMVINSSGNVGIGTNNPTQTLSVSGNINATGTVYDGVANSNVWNTTYNYVSSNFTATAPNYYAVDTTTSGVTGLLPSSPTIGRVVGFIDPYYSWATKNFVLSANVNIEGQNQPIAMNLAGIALKALYLGGSYGWRLTQ